MGMLDWNMGSIRMDRVEKSRPAWLVALLEELHTPLSAADRAALHEAGRCMDAHRVKLGPGAKVPEMVRAERGTGYEGV